MWHLSCFCVNQFLTRILCKEFHNGAEPKRNKYGCKKWSIDSYKKSFRKKRVQMGIFTKSDKSSTNSSNTTIIAAGTKIRGELQVEGSMHVDGEFSGPIDSTGIITVGKNGYIEGDVAAEKLIIAGGFSGTADCGEIRILAGGRVVGRITCKTLMIERGGIFNGQNRIKNLPIEISDRSQTEIPIRAINNTSDNITCAHS
jgi:cytoskeletal protein CcmA (bactofilin family)